VKWLADTNILLRSVQAAHPMYGDVSRAVDILFDRGDDIHIFGQNLIEFWAVATRTIPENGLGLMIPGAAVELTKLKATFIPRMFFHYGKNLSSDTRCEENNLTMRV